MDGRTVLEGTGVDGGDGLEVLLYTVIARVSEFDP